MSNNHNALMKVAKDIGIRPHGSRDRSNLPIEAYLRIVDHLNKRPRPGRSLSHEGGQMVARTLLTNTPLRTLSIVCVSLYQQRNRRPTDGSPFVLTRKESEMFAQIEHLRDVCMGVGLTLEWRLILADAWSIQLFPQLVDHEAVNAYCEMMNQECLHRGFTALRWTELMSHHADLWGTALSEARTRITPEMVRLEMVRGETRDDKHLNEEAATQAARTHIEWRAAESLVYVGLWGRQLGLSTESHALRRWDNLAVGRDQYAWHDFLPKYPHWLK